MTYLSHLECSRCGRRFDASLVQTYCHDCLSPLLAEYDLDALANGIDRDRFRRRPAGMWRWQELLPVFDERNMLTLGEGDAPLLHAPRLGMQLG
ncbi:MAG: threonine synthase, partial [Anaerolineales bacterium]